MKLSIVIPVYNTQRWLAKCLDSLLPKEAERACAGSEHCPDLELVCVNDGSTDGSGAILRDYAGRYPDFITVIETPNGGLGHARNTGLEAAKGEYVLFVDSDDWLAPGAVEEMLELLKRNPGVDAAVFDLAYVDDAGNELRLVRGTEHESEFSFASDPAFLFSPHNAVNKLWKRELFLASGIRFPDRMWFEDLATVPKLCLRLERILPVRRAWYRYYQRPGSIMSAAQAARNLDMLSVAETVERYYRAEGAFERCLPELTYKFWYEELLASVTRVNRIDPKSEIQGQLRDDFLRRFPEYKKCSYVRHAPLRLRLLADAICGGDWRAVKLMTDLNSKRKGR